MRNSSSRRQESGVRSQKNLATRAQPKDCLIGCQSSASLATSRQKPKAASHPHISIFAFILSSVFCLLSSLACAQVNSQSSIQAGDGGTPGTVEWPIIDNITIVREWEEFLSGGYDPDGPVTPSALAGFVFNPQTTIVEDFQSGSDTLKEGADLWHGVGARNGIIQRSPGGDATWDYIPAVRIGFDDGTEHAAGIEFVNDTGTDNVIEYRSSQADQATIAAETNGFFDMVFNISITQANNVTWPQAPPFPGVDAVAGDYTWRIGITADAVLTDPPLTGFYFEKVAGVTTAGSVWHGVCADGGVYTLADDGGVRDQVNLAIHGQQALRLRKYTAAAVGFNITGGAAPNSGEEFYCRSGIPDSPMTVFIQIIPRDDDVTGELTVLTYTAREQTSANPFSQAGTVGKLGWTAAFVDSRQAVGDYGTADLINQDISDTDLTNHPGVLKLSAGGINTYLGTWNVAAANTGDAAGTIFLPYGRVIGNNPEMGHEMVPTGGTNWTKRFIIRIGEEDPGTIGGSILCGISDPGQPPGPPLVFGGLPQWNLTGFFTQPATEDATGHLYWYNFMSATPTVVDTGIQAWDPAQIVDAPWLLLEFGMDNSGTPEFFWRVYNGDTGAPLIAQQTDDFDAGSWGGVSIGPYCSVDANFDGDGTSSLLIDAYGYQHNGLRQ